MDEIRLTKDAFDRLNEELDWRGGPRRREISEWIERAREHGDLRENADYDAAKNEQGHNEARVRRLEHMLKNAEVVETTSEAIVQHGMIVEILVEGDEEPTAYLYGSIEERHEELDILSPSSPLGQAVRELKPGDKTSYQGPRSAFAVEVISVRPLDA